MSTPAHATRWERPALAVLLLATAAAYLWGLDRSGWANSFYSAAAQAGSQSWTAWFFGSSDAANSITVDKPPASLWVMGLSVRLFGLSPWSILVPQALMGVGTVALLWASVRRQFGPAAGLLAGLVLALTPVAALMFRFNNPDALLVLLMVAAVWALLRAVEDGRTRWLVLSGALVGLGFLTKQLQVMLIVPALAAVYLFAGPPRLGRRLAQVAAAAAAAAMAAGWWIAAVELWPQDSRPWIGGSQHNSILELTLGYNGLGRLSGNEAGAVVPGGGSPQGGMWGAAGITRLFEANVGGQIAWLLPAALALGAGGLAARGRAPRTDPARAALLAWAGWLLTTALVFSFMQGIFHEYYTVALAPAVAALVGAGSALLWRRRGTWWARGVAAAALAATVVTAWALLGRSPDFLPPLRWVVLASGLVVAAALLVPAAGRGRAGLVTVGAALALGLAGLASYAAQTVATAHSGSIVTAGPAVEGDRGMMGGPGGGGRGSGVDGGRVDGGGVDGGGVDGGGGQGLPPGAPPGGRVPAGMAPPPGLTAPARTDGPITAGPPTGGAAGGLLNAAEPAQEVVDLLLEDADQYTWVAAAVGANSAAGFQLATQQPVMPIGGFNGSDPSPTLEQFQQHVADGQVHYFIGGGMGGAGMGGGDRGGRAGAVGTSGTSAAIAEWVAANFTARTVGGVTLYDLTESVAHE